MSVPPPGNAVRCAVVDLGSNSVRLVVYEGRGRNPVSIFNEKAVLRLGRGLETTGRLNEEGVASALTVMGRYAAIARAMRAEPFEVLATAAVRDASNGAAFVADLTGRMGGVPIHILSGAEEAALSADGVLCGIPAADGVIADIGGGSLELVEVAQGKHHRAVTLPLGVIRLAERAGFDAERARQIADADLGGVGWLGEVPGRDLYLVGGAWRAIARVQMARSAYPLSIVHHFELAEADARDLAGLLAGGSRRTLERMAGIPRRRIDDLPFAATVLRRLLKVTAARRVVFSASGLREGWYMRSVAEPVRYDDPVLAAGRDLGMHLGRDPALPPALASWMRPLFPGEERELLRLREAACWMSDIGSHDHPDYRAEQAYLRVLTQPGIGLDHAARAFLALAVALRYDADPEAPLLTTARALLPPGLFRRGVAIGMALRLGYVLSAGTPDLLAATSLSLTDRLILGITAGSGVFAGESVTRRLNDLAKALGVAAEPVAAA